MSGGSGGSGVMGAIRAVVSEIKEVVCEVVRDVVTDGMNEAKRIMEQEDRLRMGTLLYGEYRSAREAARSTEKGWGKAYSAALALDDEAREAALVDWWRVAPLDEVAAEVVWGDTIKPVEQDIDFAPLNHDAAVVWSNEAAGEAQTRDALWWMDKHKWNLCLGGHALTSYKTHDLMLIAAHWARTPAEAVAHLHRDWALIHDPANAGVTQAVFDAMESGDTQRMRQAVRAAETAARSIRTQPNTMPDQAVWATPADASSWATTNAERVAWALEAEAAAWSAAWAGEAALDAALAQMAKDEAARADHWAQMVKEQARRSTTSASRLAADDAQRAAWSAVAVYSTQRTAAAYAARAAAAEAAHAANLAASREARDAANAAKLDGAPPHEAAQTASTRARLPDRSEWARRWTVVVLEQIKQKVVG